MKDFLYNLNAVKLGAYQMRPKLIAEQYGIKKTVLAGGYGYRQILALVQNGADAILEARQDNKPPAGRNRVHTILR